MNSTCKHRKLHGLNQESFESSGLNYDATVRNLELMGEAATSKLIARHLLFLPGQDKNYRAGAPLLPG